jgi:peptide/nickel transport system ATP-binding protein
MEMILITASPERRNNTRLPSCFHPNGEGKSNRESAIRNRCNSFRAIANRISNREKTGNYFIADAAIPAQQTVAPPRHPGYHGDVLPRLEVHGLTVELPTARGWIRPVNEVSFALGEGETLGIVGESGSGKTILSLTLMGLEPPGALRSGEALLYGRTNGSETRNLVTAQPEEMRQLRGREVAMIFQEPMTALNPVMRVGAQIAEAIRIHERGRSSAEIRDLVLQALERAAVPEPARRARQYPHQLSGGLRQRVMIAMALAAGPGLLIADEPTTALDVTVQRQILELLGMLKRELQLSMLFITHDLGVVAEIADRVAVMYAGRIVEEGPVLEVLKHPRHPYTQGLIGAAPRLKREKPTPIPGTVPWLDALPSGCSFAPRCKYVRDECRSAVPELRRAAENHRARCVLVGEEVKAI